MRLSSFKKIIFIYVLTFYGSNLVGQQSLKRSIGISIFETTLFSVSNENNLEFFDNATNHIRNEWGQELGITFRFRNKKKLQFGISPSITYLARNFEIREAYVGQQRIETEGRAIFDDINLTTQFDLRVPITHAENFLFVKFGGLYGYQLYSDNKTKVYRANRIDNPNEASGANYILTDIRPGGYIEIESGKFSYAFNVGAGIKYSRFEIELIHFLYFKGDTDFLELQKFFLSFRIGYNIRN